MKKWKSKQIPFPVLDIVVSSMKLSIFSRNFAIISSKDAVIIDILIDKETGLSLDCRNLCFTPFSIIYNELENKN